MFHVVAFLKCTPPPSPFPPPLSPQPCLIPAGADFASVIPCVFSLTDSTLVGAVLGALPPYYASISTSPTPSATPSAASWPLCAAGTFFEIAATLTTNPVCTPCGLGFYSSTSTPSTGIVKTQCASIATVCPTGETYNNTAATPIFDSQCNCNSDAYSNGLTGAAIVCTLKSTTCEAGYFYSTAATLTSDRVCTVCGSGFYEESPTDSTGATVATQCSSTASVCHSNPPGRVLGVQRMAYANTAATPTSNSVCACSSHAYSNGETNASLVCTLVSATCASGYFFSTPATPTTDRGCTVCGSGFYQTVPMGSTGSTAAEQCMSTVTVCNVDQSRVLFNPSRLLPESPPKYYNTPATTTTNAVCACSEAAFSIGQTEEGKVLCTLKTTFCGAGAFYQSAPTATSTAVCTSCTQGINFRSSQTLIYEATPNACTLVTVCQGSGGEYDNIPATRSADITCRCAQGASSNSGSGASLVCLPAVV